MTDIDPKAFPLWQSRAEFIRVKDGDTWVLRRDFGEEIERTPRAGYRLWGLDVYEKGTPLGDEALEYAERWFAEHRHGLANYPLLIVTDKDRQATYEKQTLARYVVKMWCRAYGHSFEDAMRTAGYEKEE